MGRSVKGGYILLETLIAMGILGMSMIGIHRSVSEALFVQGRTRDFSRANFLMEQMVNEIAARPQMVVSGEQGTFKDYPRFSYDCAYTKVIVPTPTDRPQGMTQIEFDRISEQFTGYMGKLTVSIYWNRGGQPFSRTAETLFKPEHLWVPRNQ